MKKPVTKGQTLCDSTYRMYLEQSNLWRQSSGCQGLWGEGNGGLMFNGGRVSVGEDAEVLERDGGDGCTTV